MCVWWNYQVRAVVTRKEYDWEEVLGARYEDARETCDRKGTKDKRSKKYA